ncbi:hypothetical protein SAMN03159485_00842 [Pseudomonas sp. NFPP24]|nr:hypothetical protein SAMN03159485_00842 [Pseudomonas sp. NFPP24]
MMIILCRYTPLTLSLFNIIHIIFDWRWWDLQITVLIDQSNFYFILTKKLFHCLQSITSLNIGFENIWRYKF